jgi:hypothetical protein
VTRQGVDGGELALQGCPRWSWRRPGRRGVLARGRCEVGLVLGFLQGGDQVLGVEGGGCSKERERGEGSAGVLPRALLPPSIQPDTIREKGF